MTPVLNCVDLFQRQVARTPDACSLRSSAAELTYRQLDERSDAVAAELVDRGAGRGALVAIAVSRSIELIVAVLGTMKTGGAYVPLDLSYPEARLSSILNSSGATLILADGPALETLKSPSWLGGRAAILKFEDIPDRAAALGLESTLGRGDGPAYVLYTSGSTGSPKGVVMTHRPLANLIAWHLGRERPFDVARTAQFAPIGFDVSFQEIFSTLCAGGALALMRDEERRDPDRLLDFLTSQRISRLFLPTPALIPLAEYGLRRPPPSDLRMVICAGDRLQITDAVREWFGAMPDCRLENHYGPTESHVVVAHVLPRCVDDWAALPPIGQPLPHVRVHVLDAERREVDPGNEGELYLGGDCLAEGYRGLPKLTAERFLPDLSGSGRLYRTGDIVRRAASGELEFIGRADRQLKILGHRVEPEEIEAVLAAHPGVLECAVAVGEDVAGQKRLTAYATVRKDAHPTLESGWRGYLGERLPRFMVPAELVIVDRLPKTSSGKIDRPALAAALKGAARPSEHQAPPRGGMEQTIASLWRESLKIDMVGLDDNFFDLGGHSLLLVHVHGRLKNALGADFSITILFEHPTIRSLAARLSGLAVPIADRNADESDARAGGAMRARQLRGLRRIDTDESGERSS